MEELNLSRLFKVLIRPHSVRDRSELRANYCRRSLAGGVSWIPVLRHDLRGSCGTVVHVTSHRTILEQTPVSYSLSVLGQASRLPRVFVSSFSRPLFRKDKLSLC